MTSTQPLTVRCPACRASLTIAADQAGGPVVCQACGRTLKVPRATTPAPPAGGGGDNDEDWLNLDSPAPPPLSAPAPPPPPPAARSVQTPAAARPPRQPATAGLQTAVPVVASEPGLGPAPLSDKDLELLQQYTGRHIGEPEPPPAPTAASPPVDDSFRVTCKTCGSMLYAKPTQVGRTVRCSDCHSSMQVPPPPPPKPVYRPPLEEAESFRFQGGDEPLAPRPSDPFVKTAAELLAKAEAAEAAEQEEWELPAFGSWFSGLAVVFRDLILVLHVFFLSLLAFLPLALIVLIPNPALLLMGIAVSLLFGGLLLANAFAVLQAVANGQEKVEEWATFDPMGWIGNLLLTVVAMGVAAGPAFGFAHFVLPGGMLTLGLSMLSLYVLFPIVLLSMLESESVFVPFSADVTKSVSQVPGQWGAAYFASGGLFLAVFFMLLVAGVCPPLVAAGLLVVTTVIGTFAYFGILGRLAYGIGQSINALPMDNDIERIRQRERNERGI